MWTAAPTSPRLASTGSAKPLCRQRGPEPRLPEDIFFSLLLSPELEGTPPRCLYACRLRAAVRQWQPGWEAQASHSHIATATGDNPYPVPAAGTPRRVALDTDRAPAGSRQSSQSSVTGYGTRGIPKALTAPQLHCNPCDIQQIKLQPPETDFVLVVPLT